MPKTPPPNLSQQANTGGNTNRPPNGQSSATPTTDGEMETSNGAATAATSTPNPQPNTNAGKPPTPNSAPVRIPKHLSELLKRVLNESIELLVIPDSAVMLVTETTSKRLDPACWVILRLPPILTDPPLDQGVITKIK